MTDETGHMPFRLYPTPQRPLLGLTVLLVEDSRFASEAIRLMCLRSGARIRRADSIRAARRHLAAYRPAVAVVDLGLPDGSGLDLLAEMSNGSDPLAVRLATSGDDGRAAQARQAGAQGFLQKPVENLAYFQDVILSLLPETIRPRGPRVVPADTISPDPVAYRDDMAHIAGLLAENAEGDMTLIYIAQFAEAAALCARDDALASAARTLHKAAREGQVAEGPVTRLRALAAQRMERRAAI